MRLQDILSFVLGNTTAHFDETSGHFSAIFVATQITFLTRLQDIFELCFCLFLDEKSGHFQLGLQATDTFRQNIMISGL